MVLRLGDAEGASVDVESTWRNTARARQTRGKCQTEPLRCVEAAVQAVDRAEMGVQARLVDGRDEFAEAKEPESGETPRSDADGTERDGGEAKSPGADDGELEAFVAMAGPLMLRELRRSDASHAFTALALAAKSGSELDQGRFGADAAAAAGGRREEASVLHTLLRPQGDLEEAENLSCTAVAWNATGSQLLAGYGRFDNYGWCAHRGSVCIWNVFARSAHAPALEESTAPDVRLETSSGVMCVAAHPVRPSVLAVGTFNGEILLFDTTLADVGEDSMVDASQVEDFCHREPVRELVWVPQTVVSRDGKAGAIGRGSAPGAGSEYVLASTSGDGRVLVWDVFGVGLQAPIRGLNLAPRRSKAFGGTALAFWGGAGATGGAFVVGSEGGALTRGTIQAAAARDDAAAPPPGRGWTASARRVLAFAPAKERAQLRRNGDKFLSTEDVQEISARQLYEASRADRFCFAEPTRFAFRPHIGPVSAVSCSPYRRNAFLSCGADGAVSLYSTLDRDPVLTVSPAKGGQLLHSCAWSPHRPAVFACAASSGEVFVFDLSASLSAPVLSLQSASGTVPALPGQPPVFHLAFNHRTRGLLASGDEAGNVRIFKLGWRLGNRQPVDKAALDMAFRGAATA